MKRFIYLITVFATSDVIEYYTTLALMLFAAGFALFACYILYSPQLIIIGP